MESNKHYSLSELFSTDHRKIIIPDFQRDYCWGDETHGAKQDTDIVSGFMDTLFEEFEATKKSGTKEVLLGKIDVYENPKDHIYLTDGQQRLTTLFLLIGMLYKYTKDERLKRCLIAECEERKDDKEPYLQYAIRESTVFFLRDLVNEFFLAESSESIFESFFKKDKNAKPILKPNKISWFFDEYYLDPTIISMLNALRIIEEKLDSFTPKENLQEFSSFIIDDIKIQYYDVVDRNHGEERFVIINTTGRSLTETENLKPILVGGVEGIYAKQWEERETYFWKNRDKEKEKTADAGVNEFMKWCFRIIEKKDEVNLIKDGKAVYKEKKQEKFLNRIHALFLALQKLTDILTNENVQKQLKFVTDKKISSIAEIRKLTDDQQKNIVLPLLAFIEKFYIKNDCNFENPIDEKIILFLRRLRKNYFDQKWKDRNANYSDWHYILQMIEKSNSVVQLLQYESTKENAIDSIQNVVVNEWYNTDEKIKSKLKEAHIKEIEIWEDTPEFMGDLSFLFKTALVEKENIPELSANNEFDFTQLEQIYKNYENTVGLIRNEEKAHSNTKLANLFRLFRLYVGCTKIGYIYRTSGMEGCLFSTLNRSHLTNIEFMHLLKSSNLEEFIINNIQKNASEESLFEGVFDVKKLVKAWLTFKVFYANENNTLLAFYDGNKTGVAAYTDIEKNKLIETEDFSLANSICGFAVKSGGGGGNYVHYTGKENWLKPNIIDTPFDAVDIQKEKRTIEQIEKNKKIIDRIITSISDI